jgi:DEAD/DEAH box helicase
MLHEGIDVLIATPGRISTLLEDGALSLDDCRAVVLDEVPAVISLVIDVMCCFQRWCCLLISEALRVTIGGS